MSSSWRAQVYLVGAGPGDPGLLTRRGEACIRRADVILYDNLTSPRLLELARPGVRRVYVGKKARQARPEQQWINEQLISEARAGNVVVRLKGGDSFVFGRGGEEVLALAEAGIRFEVVPGVSSVIAAPASAGIPVTYRGSNTAVHAAVGFEDPESPDCSVPWEALGATGQTIVIMMATHHIQGILRRLRAGGLSPGTPVVTVHNGTYPSQRSKRTTLGEALVNLEAVHLPPPSITIVGSVAGSPEAFNWFERRPLFGRRLLLTRPAESEGTIAAALEEAGAEVVNLPATRFSRVELQAGRLKQALETARGGWLILPSPSAIRFFFAALSAEGLDTRSLAGVNVAVIGGRSRESLLEHGLRADHVAPDSNAGSLAGSLPPSERAVALVAGSRMSRPELREGLEARDLRVEHLVLYDTAPDEEGLELIRGRLAEPGWEGIAFAPSAVRAMIGAISLETLRTVRWFAIGPTTESALRDAGLSCAGAAARPDADALVAVLSAQPPPHQGGGDAR